MIPKNLFWCCKETSLPEKEDFYTNVNMEDISNANYKHSKRVCREFVSLKVCVEFQFFVQQKAQTLWLENVTIPLQIKIIEKQQVVTKNVEIQWYLREFVLPKSWPGDGFFKLRKSKFLERKFLPKLAFK